MTLFAFDLNIVFELLATIYFPSVLCLLSTSLSPFELLHSGSDIQISGIEDESFGDKKTVILVLLTKKSDLVPEGNNSNGCKMR